MAGGVTIDGSCGAFLAYPTRNYALQSEWYETQHRNMVAPVVEPNGEGLEALPLIRAAC